MGDLGENFPRIESSPGVMGGVACITRTRIPVWVLEQAGSSEPETICFEIIQPSRFRISRMRGTLFDLTGPT